MSEENMMHLIISSTWKTYAGVHGKLAQGVTDHYSRTKD